MDEATRRLIEEIHAAPRRCVLAVTGGGASTIASLLGVPGGSRTILEAVVPYGEEALVDYLGHAPRGFCSKETGRELAERAFARASWLAPGRDVVGLGATASLVSDRPKKGDHRCHVAVRSDGRLVCTSLTFIKGARSRREEERVLEIVLLNTLAEAFRITSRLPVPLQGEERLEVEEWPLGDPLGRLLDGSLERLCVAPDGRFVVDAPSPVALLSGAFNPVHAGHWLLADTVSLHIGQATSFELSVHNADKPPLARGEVCRRLLPFAWKGEVWLTRAPTFAEKARLFPGATFAVGIDTAERIVQPRFYDGSPEKMAEALAFLSKQGCRFLVAGRADAAGKFRSLADLDVPAAHRELFAGIPESEFHVNLSSTELRRQAAKE